MEYVDPVLVQARLFQTNTLQVYSPSAFAAVGLILNLARAGFPLFSKQLWDTLGYQWGGSVLAFAAVFLAPFPYVLGWWGRD